MTVKDMNPAFYISFITDFIKHVHKEDYNGQKLGLVASGHSGCYSLEVAKNNTDLFDRILIANAGFKGPFPHVKEMLERKGKANLIPIADKVFILFWYLYTTPGLGNIVNHLMTGKLGITGQLKGHVYEDPANVTPELVTKMTALCRMTRPKELQPSFMLGYLDPYSDIQ